MATQFFVAQGAPNNWSNVANWASSSGGLSGSGRVPIAGDNATFDTLSSAIAYTMTFDTATVALGNLVMGAPLVGALTTAGSGAVNINGNFSLASGSVWGGTGAFTFAGTTGGTIDTNGVALNNRAISVAPTSLSSWQLLSNLVHGVVASFTGGTFTLGANASFDWNGKTHTSGAFTVNGAAGSRTLTFGAATVNVATGAFTYGPTGTLGSYTFNAGTSTINLPINAANGSINITVAAAWYNFTVAGGGSIQNGGSYKLGGSTFNSITFNSAANGTYGLYAVDASFTTATLVVTGADNAGNRIGLITTGTPGTAITITVTSSFSLTNADFGDITAAGAAGTWTGASLGNMLGCSNITFDTPRHLFFVNTGTQAWNTSANWSLTTGGATGNNPPIPQDDVTLDGNSAGDSNTQTTINFKSLDTTGYTHTLTASTNNQIFGNFLLSTTMTFAGNWGIIFRGRSGQTITTNSADLGAGVPIIWTSPGNAYTLQDSFTATGGTIVLVSGTIDDNGKAVTAAAWQNVGTLARELKGSATWTLTGAGTPYTTATNTNLTQSNFSGTFKFTNSSATNKTIATGGFNASTTNMWNNTGSTGQWRFTGSGTFNDIKLDAGRDWHLTAGTTTTFSSLTVPASITNAITIDSITAATHTLSCSSVNAVVAYGCTIGHSIFTGTAVRTAYLSYGNVDNGNNTGWDFGYSQMFNVLNWIGA